MDVILGGNMQIRVWREKGKVIYEIQCNIYVIRILEERRGWGKGSI